MLAIAIVAIQRIGFAVLGNGPARTLFLDTLIILANGLAILGSLIAASRASRVTRYFWILFASAFVLQMAADAGWAWVHLYHVHVTDNSLMPSLFYRLYAGPMAIALFLSEDVRASRLESFLDGCIVVGLVGLSMYQVQLGELQSHDPEMWRVISVGTGVNLLLMLCAAARFAFAPDGNLRRLFARQAIYLGIYAVVSLVTSIGDAYFPNIDDSIDLIWIVPYLAGAVIAITWFPQPVSDAPARQRISRRASLLAFNLTLATMVLGSTVLGLRLLDSTRVISLLAITIVLFSYAIRSALMQDKQEKYLEALKESRAQLQHQALYDELTGLANRRLFGERMAQTLAIARREGQTAALLYFDLDGFKSVNDRLGHAVGDQLLKETARRVSKRVRASDTLVRMGGDEFALLLGNLRDSGQAEMVAGEVLRALTEPFHLSGNTVEITGSLGIGVFPGDASSGEQLIHQADCAMYAVKRDGGNHARYYSADLEEPVAVAREEGDPGPARQVIRPVVRTADARPQPRVKLASNQS